QNSNQQPRFPSFSLLRKKTHFHAFAVTISSVHKGVHIALSPRPSPNFHLINNNLGTGSAKRNEWAKHAKKPSGTVRPSTCSNHHSAVSHHLFFPFPHWCARVCGF